MTVDSLISSLVCAGLVPCLAHFFCLSLASFAVTLFSLTVATSLQLNTMFHLSSLGLLLLCTQSSLVEGLSIPTHKGINKCRTTRSKRNDEISTNSCTLLSPFQNSMHRREILNLNVNMLVSWLVLRSQGATASTIDSESSITIDQTLIKRKVKKPFAPPEALLPATRVKLLIDQSILLVEELMSLQKDNRINENSSKREQEIIWALKQYLLLPTTYTVPLNVSTNQISKKKSVNMNSFSNSKLYDEAYNQILKSVPPQDIPYVSLVKLGEEREISILRSRQRSLERQNPVREAFNIYTRQLQFDTEYYILNTSAEEKKKMIRNDTLPDIKSVIVSDLDLRDLVRNQVLDAVDDSKAELIYQMKQMEENRIFDGSELKKSLLQAQTMMNHWFSFISDGDVAVAIANVSKEMLSYNQISNN